MAIDLWDILTIVGIVLLGASVYMGLGLLPLLGYVGAILMIVGAVGASRTVRRPD